MTRKFYYQLMVCVIHILFIQDKIAAQNLVLNSSFEDTLSCPSVVTYPFIKAQYWFQPTAGSSDFFSIDTTCIYSGGGGVPQNVFGFQYPHFGESFCGFAIYAAPPNQNNREYITGTLTDSLISGKKYCVSLFVSAANNYKYQTDDIGIYFSNDTSFADYSMNNTLNLIPQVVSTQGNMLTDTLNWMQIIGDFIAQGGEKFITIGNFKNDASTTLTLLPGAIYNAGYYYIDDVSVIDCTVGLDEINLNKMDFSIHPNPVNDLLNINLKQTKFNSITYSINNVLGELVTVGEITSNNSTINISKLVSGLYIIRFYNLNEILVKHFVKL